MLALFQQPPLRIATVGRGTEGPRKAGIKLVYGPEYPNFLDQSVSLILGFTALGRTLLRGNCIEMNVLAEYCC